MVRPLYRFRDGANPRRGPRGHAGLWFDKFCDKWQPKPKWEIGQNKLKWINELAGKSVGNAEQIEENARRLMGLAQAAGGHAEVFTTEFRFVTGLGRSHPVENGFAWHPTLGTPFLPGSSVKGMVRAWAKAEAISFAKHERLLGSPGEVGRVLFLDAVPVQPVSLEADVMTPHFAEWSPEDPPGDWRSPTPIPFLTTAAGTPFLFCFMPTVAAEDDDLRVTSRWLRDALAWAGAGAKTAVGYGRMKRDEAFEEDLHGDFEQREQEAQAKREEEGRLAAMSPIERDIEQILLTDRRDKNTPTTTAIFQEIDRGRWEGDDKKAAARWLATKMQAERKWRTTSQKKRPDKDKDHQRTLRVQGWLDE